jgi:hypothetical protein
LFRIQLHSPQDEAITVALQTLSGASAGTEVQLTVDDLLAVPGIATLLEYHILPGLYNTSYFRNDSVSEAQRECVR